MKKLILLVTLFISSISLADECMDANLETQPIKRELSNVTGRIVTDYGSNTDLLLKVYDKLEDDLKKVNRLAEVSESTLKYCAGRTLTKEVYSLKNKQFVLMSILDANKYFKTFYDTYIIPNDTWTDVAKIMEKDILNKRNKIEESIKESVQRTLVKEAEKKKQFDAEKRKSQELHDLVEKSKKAQKENRELKESIHSSNVKKVNKVKPISNTKSTYKRKQSNTYYRQGQSKHYVEKERLFCLSKRQYDYQYQVLLEGVHKFVDQCFSTAIDLDVVVLDSGIGTSKVKSISNNMIMWVDSEAVKRR